MKTHLKDIFVTGSFLAATLGAYSQEQYKVKGTFAVTQNGQKCWLIKQTGSAYAIDSSEVKNGAFSFTGSARLGDKAILILSHDNRSLALIAPSGVADLTEIYLEREPILISGKDSLLTAGLQGGALNADNLVLRNSLKQVSLKLRLLAAKASNRNLSDSARRLLMSQYQNLITENKTEVEKFISTHPSSKVSMDNVITIFNPEEDLAKSEFLFRSLSSTLRQTPEAKAYAEKLSSLKKLAIGMEAPDFNLPDTAGRNVSLKSFRGKYVLVDFWASWCKPCREENPNVREAFEKYNKKNFTILGVSLDQTDGKNKWLKAIHDDQLKWTQVSDLQFWNSKAARIYGIRSIPSNLLIDPKGIIVAKNVRGPELIETLKSLLH